MVRKSRYFSRWNFAGDNTDAYSDAYSDVDVNPSSNSKPQKRTLSSFFGVDDTDEDEDYEEDYEEDIEIKEPVTTSNDTNSDVATKAHIEEALTEVKKEGSSWDNALKKAGNFWQGVKDTVSTAGQTVAKGAVTAGKAIASGAATAGQAIASGAATAGQAVVNTASAAIDGLINGTQKGMVVLSDLIEQVSPQAAVEAIKNSRADKNNPLKDYIDFDRAEDMFSDLVKTDASFRSFILGAMAIYQNPKLIDKSETGRANLKWLGETYELAVNSVTLLAMNEHAAEIDKVAMSTSIDKNTLSTVCQEDHEMTVQAAMLMVLDQFSGLENAKDEKAIRDVLGGFLTSVEAVTSVVNMLDAQAAALAMDEAAASVVEAANTNIDGKTRLELIVNANMINNIVFNQTSDEEIKKLVAEIEQARNTRKDLQGYGVASCCTLISKGSWAKPGVIIKSSEEKAFNALKPVCAKWKKTVEDIATQEAQKEQAKNPKLPLPQVVDKYVDELLAKVSKSGLEEKQAELQTELAALAAQVGTRKLNATAENLEKALADIVTFQKDGTIDPTTLYGNLRKYLSGCSERGIRTIIAIASGSYQDARIKASYNKYANDVKEGKRKLREIGNAIAEALLVFNQFFNSQALTTAAAILNSDAEVAAAINLFMKEKLNDAKAIAAAQEAIGKGETYPQLDELIVAHLKNKAINPEKETALKEGIYQVLRLKNDSINNALTEWKKQENNLFSKATDEAWTAVADGKENEEIDKLIDEFLEASKVDARYQRGARNAILHHIKYESKFMKKNFSRSRYADKLNNLRRIKIAMRRYYSACKNYELPEESSDFSFGAYPECFGDSDKSFEDFCGGRTFSKKRRVMNPFSRYNFADEEEIVDEESEEAEEAAPIDEEPAEDFDEGMEDEGMEAEDTSMEDDMGDEDYAEDDMSMDEELPEEGEEKEDYDMSADEVDSGDEDFEAEDEEEDMYAAPAVCAPRGEDMQVGHWSDSVVDSQLDDLSQSEDADMYDSKQGELTLSAANAGEAMAMQNELATLRGINNAESNFSRRRSAVRRSNPRTATLRSLLGDKYLR